MKKIKNTLLSVLLFSFAFLVIHDYTIAQISSSPNHELSFSKSSALIESDCTTLSVESQIHESIHSMIVITMIDPIEPSLLLDNKPSDIEHGSATHSSFVLERPPLS